MNPRVLVLGDLIFDHYKFGRATRICPEAPAPVLVVDSEEDRWGGAGLVSRNLESLGLNCEFIPGSESHKIRYYAGHQLVCRVDNDRFSARTPVHYMQEIWEKRLGSGLSAIVVSDYDKGAITEPVANFIIKKFAAELGVPVFVDAKCQDVLKYSGAYCLFPNEHEHNGIPLDLFAHVVRKFGGKGCSVDGKSVPTVPQQVYDVCGAGDVFLAGFVAKFVTLRSARFGEKMDQESEACDLLEAAAFANKVAGISVRHLGTYVIQPEDLI